MPHIDNAAYAVVLSERVHTRVEEFGRVELQDTEAAALVRSKVVHMVLLVLGVLMGVASGDKRGLPSPFPCVRVQSTRTRAPFLSEPTFVDIVLLRALFDGPRYVVKFSCKSTLSNF